jgi:hypothetical protein
VRYWRALLWLLPLATAIPLGIFVYQLITSDFSAYFGSVKLVGLIFLLGIPNVVILGASVTAAMITLRGNLVAALVILAVVSAIQLTMLMWSMSVGQLDGERAPGTAPGLHANRAAVALDHPPGNR